MYSDSPIASTVERRIVVRKSGQVATWRNLVENRPDIAEAGRALLYQHGVGLAFLATVTTGGRPRVHPMCPLLNDGGLYAFIVPSPKQNDLRRVGLYSLHSFPCSENEDAFYLSGRAQRIGDPLLWRVMATQFVQERDHLPIEPPGSEDMLFQFEFDTVLLTRTIGHGDPAPTHLVWRSDPER